MLAASPGNPCSRRSLLGVTERNSEARDVRAAATRRYDVRKRYEMLEDARVVELARKFISNGLSVCQSALVNELVEQGFDGFDYDDIENLYPDPSAWGLDECREFLQERGGRMPEDDPYLMDDAELRRELLNIGIDPGEDDTATLRAAVIANYDDGIIPGNHYWRNRVRDIAEPAEIFEWWVIADSMVLDDLLAQGECVIDNDYGRWWGRCCTGQANYLDSTFREMALRWFERNDAATFAAIAGGGEA
jgi:hypothetical protein